MADLIIYSDGELELDVSVDGETIWLRQDEIALIFNINRTGVTRHINKILKDKEIEEKTNVQKMHFANSDKLVKLYSLDIILAVGYRANSSKAIKFRQWATSVLKSYMLNGYAINSDKITHQRFKELENDVISLKLKVEDISNKLEDKTIKPKQGIFFDGQIFDAYLFVSGLVKKAKNSIVLIDNYCDETTLSILSKCKEEVKIIILTKTITKELKIDLQKYNAQYTKIEAKEFASSHDRFLILDGVEIYHIGASLKDLGKKWFAFSLLEAESFGLMQRVKKLLDR
ncbi:MAG: RhuM family protein [Sulfurovaceae bacterium]|nr:RhuM family protein [Sulfurovaceae bacterium]